MLKGNLTCEDISRLILPYIDDKLNEALMGMKNLSAWRENIKDFNIFTPLLSF